MTQKCRKRRYESERQGAKVGLSVAPASSLFRYWLLATIVLGSLSLLIDAADVIRYLRGERDPYLETPA